MFGRKKDKNEKKPEIGSKVVTTTVTQNSGLRSTYTEERRIITHTSSTQNWEITSSGSSIIERLGDLHLNTSLRDPNESIFSPRISTDAQRFEPSLLPTSQLTRGAQPYRSVYTRDPTTRTYSPRSSVPSVGSKNPSVACLSVPPPLQKSSSYTSVSRNEPRPYLATSVSTGALPSQPVSSKLKVKVLKTGKLYDSLSNKIPTYQTHSKNRGKALVINNIKFLDEKQYRQGAEVDETNITKLFKEMGFKVINHRDKTKSQMERIITTYTKDKDLKTVDINVVVIMSHGTGKERHDSTEVVGTDEELLPTTWILGQFDNENCKHLQDKPKIFIFQCCRGQGRDISHTLVQHDAVPFNVPARKFADMLIAYSTVPGFVSHRDPQTGTWYIQTICEVFMEHAHDTDVESMLKMVDAKLAKLVANSNSRQTTSYENRGFKNCYLHPK